MASKPKADQTLADQITNLAVGESLSKSQRFTMAEVAEEGIKDALGKMRNMLNQAVSRIRKKSGLALRVESGTMLTDDQEAIIATVCVTRIGEDGDDTDDLGI
jgi:hypothetical protein